MANTIKCDKCGNERIIAYHKYVENINRCGYYGCKKCSLKKRKITSIERFGVDNYAKTDECKNKISKNNIKKYIQSLMGLVFLLHFFKTNKYK